jgi:hypothetical protein
MDGKSSLLKYMRLSRYGIGHVYGIQKWPAGCVPANKLFSEKNFIYAISNNWSANSCNLWSRKGAVTTWPWDSQPQVRQPAWDVYLVAFPGSMSPAGDLF